MMKTKKQFNKSRWSRRAVTSQAACNPLGLMNSMVECLREWRDSEEWNGTDDDKKCIPLQLMTFQLHWLLTGELGNYPGGTEGWRKDMETMEKWTNVFPDLRLGDPK